jgi:hypothetical protein
VEQLDWSPPAISDRIRRLRLWSNYFIGRDLQNAHE